jgi:hypothetical protein
MSDSRAWLRHTVAVVAYRGAKVCRDAPPTFADFRASEQARTPVEIVAHIGDLFDWGLSLAKGQQTWQNTPPLPWKQEVERFFATVGRFDAYLASVDTIACPAERLFQGPIADALSHIGQIAILRRIAGVPIRGENYFQADVKAGRVGAAQSPPKFEFD